MLADAEPDQDFTARQLVEVVQRRLASMRRTEARLRDPALSCEVESDSICRLFEIWRRSRDLVGAVKQATVVVHRSFLDAVRRARKHGTLRLPDGAWALMGSRHADHEGGVMETDLIEAVLRSLPDPVEREVARGVLHRSQTTAELARAIGVGKKRVERLATAVRKKMWDWLRSRGLGGR